MSLQPEVSAGLHAAGYTQLGVTEDDILLEVVILVGVLCSETTAAALVDSGLVGAAWLQAACLPGNLSWHVNRRTLPSALSS